MPELYSCNPEGIFLWLMKNDLKVAVRFFSKTPPDSSFAQSELQNDKQIFYVILEEAVLSADEGSGGARLAGPYRVIASPSR